MTKLSEVENVIENLKLEKMRIDIWHLQLEHLSAGSTSRSLCQYFIQNGIVFFITVN